MSPSIEERVFHVIADAQRLPLADITIDKTLAELGIDSMDGISLLFALENEFDISIPDDVAKSIRTVREMVDGVTGALNHSASPPPAAL